MTKKLSDSDKPNGSSRPLYYKDAGVDRLAARNLVDSIRALNKSAHPALLQQIGGFASLYELPSYKKPVLVTATDGVGTKIELAAQLDKHRILGIDLVAMCVNDLICCGAEPLVFLDYYATSRINPEQGRELITGIMDGCAQAGCLLVGGETAEMPGFYRNDSYDLAGFIAGIVEKDAILHPCAEAGSVIIGLPSSGVHANGFSLVRKLLADKLLDLQQACGKSNLAEALLQPTKIYAHAINKLKRANIQLQGVAHITGGGITENLPRSLPQNLSARIDFGAEELPHLFQLLQQAAAIPNEELYSTFNCGIGITIIVPQRQARQTVEILKEEKARIIGSIKPREGKSAVIYE